MGLTIEKAPSRWKPQPYKSVDKKNKPDARYKQILGEEEGNRADIYLDSEGYPTAGIGHLLTAAERKKFGLKKQYSGKADVSWLSRSWKARTQRYDDKAIDKWFKADTAKAYSQAGELMEENEIGDNPELQQLLAMQVYQSGKEGVAKFPSMLQALWQGDYNTAADNMLYNFNADGTTAGKTLWHTQTPRRVWRQAHMMRRLDPKYQAPADKLVSPPPGLKSRRMKKDLTAQYDQPSELNETYARDKSQTFANMEIMR